MQFSNFELPGRILCTFDRAYVITRRLPYSLSSTENEDGWDICNYEYFATGRFSGGFLQNRPSSLNNLHPSYNKTN